MSLETLLFLHIVSGILTVVIIRRERILQNTIPSLWMKALIAVMALLVGFPGLVSVAFGAMCHRMGNGDAKKNTRPYESEYGR